MNELAQGWLSWLLVGTWQASVLVLVVLATQTVEHGCCEGGVGSGVVMLGVDQLPGVCQDLFGKGAQRFQQQTRLMMNQPLIC